MLAGPKKRWWTRAWNRLLKADEQEVPDSHLSPTDRYVSDDGGDPEASEFGVAFSGGGVRSAIFNLGVLQRMDEDDFLREVDHLAAVSGGCYIAGAYWITAAHSPSGVFDDVPPWAHGSPEEQYFRRELDYLARGMRGWVWFALNVIYGVVLNYLPLLLAAGVAGRTLGWTYSAMDLGHRPGAGGTPLVPSAVIWAFAAFLLLVGLIAVGVRRLAERDVGEADWTQHAQEAVTLVWSAFLVIVSLGLLGPALVHLYRQFLGRVMGGMEAFESASELDRRLVGAIMFIGILLVIAGLAAALVRVRWMRLPAQLVSSLAGVGLLLVPFVAGAEAAAREGLNEWSDLGESLGLLLLLVLLGIGVHNGRYSLHLFYKERLQHAFAVKRSSASRPADAMEYTVPIRFTEVSTLVRQRTDLKLPNLIVCASVTVRDRRIAPRGRWAESFVFTEDKCGSPTLGRREMRAYEVSSGKVELTLPALMAISGAALSPTMGRFTMWQHRFILAMLNVRLGVWIRNPDHPYSTEIGRLRREADLPVGPKRSIKAIATRLRAKIKIGWFEPGALYVFREARGWGKSDARFLHVADGGHLDNLGLLELVRRRCRTILCFDASGDENPLLGELGSSIAIVRAELGASVEFSAAEVARMNQDDRPDPTMVGTVRYPDGTIGTVVYARSCLSASAPIDVHMFAARDRGFPHHRLLNQVYSDERFEAYRALGHHAASAALARIAEASVPTAS